VAVDHPPEVMVQVEGVLDADEVALVAHATRPLPPPPCCHVNSHKSQVTSHKTYRRHVTRSNVQVTEHAVQYTKAKYSTEQHRTVQHSTVQYSEEQLQHTQRTPVEYLSKAPVRMLMTARL